MSIGDVGLGVMACRERKGEVQVVRPRGGLDRRGFCSLATHTLPDRKTSTIVSWEVGRLFHHGHSLHHKCERVTYGTEFE